MSHLYLQKYIHFPYWQNVCRCISGKLTNRKCFDTSVCPCCTPKHPVSICILEARQALVTITGSDIRHEVKVTQGGRDDSTFVYIHHTNPVFSIPRISGDRVVGFVNWGDGQPQEEYQADLAHTYSTGQQEHRVTLKVWGAEEIELPTIQGVTEVDLSEF